MNVHILLFTYKSLIFLSFVEYTSFFTALSWTFMSIQQHEHRFIYLLSILFP